MTNNQPKHHPIIAKMLVAIDNLPDHWHDEEDEKYCLTNAVIEEVENLGNVSFIVLLFEETKSNLGRRLFLLSPLLAQNNLYKVFIEVLKRIKNNDLAVYHFLAMLQQDFGIDVSQLKEIVKSSLAFKYCNKKNSTLEKISILNSIEPLTIERLKKEGAPILKIT